MSYGFGVVPRERTKGRYRGYEMNRPRFTLKAILGCTAALSVPLAVFAAGIEFGLPCLVVVACGCTGYLVHGRDGVILGLMLGIPTVLVVGAVASLVYQWLN